MGYKLTGDTGRAFVKIILPRFFTIQNVFVIVNRLMKERILAFMDAMQSNDAALISDWFSDDAVLWIPPAQPVCGISRVRALFRAMFNRYDFLKWTIIDILPVSDNRCIHICESYGKIKGCDEYRNRVITDITFNNEGKISSLSDYFKDTSVFSNCIALHQPAFESEVGK